MVVWSIVCFERVLATFQRKQDADQVLVVLKRLSSMPCSVCQDTLSTGESHRFIFKRDSTESLNQLLSLLTRPTFEDLDRPEES